VRFSLHPACRQNKPAPGAQADATTGKELSMSPIFELSEPSWDSPIYSRRKPRKTRYLNNSYDAAMARYKEYKLWIPAFYALWVFLLSFAGGLAYVAKNHGPVPLVGLAEAGAIFLTGLTYVATLHLSFWLLVKAETRAWNEGTCAETGLPWFRTGTKSAGGVLFGSNGRKPYLWLRYIEPDEAD
jgi:hypothetical protein